MLFSLRKGRRLVGQSHLLLMLLLLLPRQICAQGVGQFGVVPNVPHSARSLAFSPDGDLMISGGEDGTVQLWNFRSGRLLKTFIGHSKEVQSVALSADGTKVISASKDKTIKVWDLGNGTLVSTKVLKVEAKELWCIRLSPDGASALSGQETDKVMRLWDVASGRLVRTFPAGGSYSIGVTSASFSPDGRQAVSLADAYLKIWDTSSGRLLRSIGNSAGPITISSDGRKLISSVSEASAPTVNVWDLSTGAAIGSFAHPAGTLSVHAAALSPDGKILISGGSTDPVGRKQSADYVAKNWFWDLRSGRLLSETVAGYYSVATLKFAPDGNRFVSTDQWTAIRLWNLEARQLVNEFGIRHKYFSSPFFSADATQIIAGGGATPSVLDASSGQVLRWLASPGEKIYSADISRDGAKVLWRLADEERLQLWDATKHKIIATLGGHQKRVLSAVISPDGSRIASGGYDNMLKIWDSTTGRLMHSFPHSASVESVVFSPDGKVVFAGDFGGNLVARDGYTGTLLWTFRGAKEIIHSLSPSADGTRLIVCTSEPSPMLLDATNGKVIRRFEGQTGPIFYGAVFSPSGRELLSGSYDKTVKLWDTSTGKVLRTWNRDVRSLAFSPDGSKALMDSDLVDLRTGATLISIYGAEEQEWLSITPHGFFTSSRNGAAILSAVRGTNAVSIEQAKQSLLNPDLVRAAIAGDPDNEVVEAAKVINLEKVFESGPAPEVTLLPQDLGRQVTTDVIAMNAVVTDKGKGVGRIEWRVNGITAAVPAKPSGPGPEYALTQQLALDPGDNVIEVVAYNGNNLLSSLPARATITLTGATDTTKPKLHVLAIGINTYVDRGWTPPGQSDLLAFPPLGLAAKDATAFGESMKLAAVNLYADVRLTTVTDAEATRENLGRVIDGIAAEVHPRDTFILFAAAHGKSEAGRFYLIPQDYDGGPNPEALAERAIDQATLQDWLANRIKAKKALILLDTCESGALVGGYSRSRTETPSSEAALGRLHEATGRPVLTAAAEGKPAFEGYEGHGVFTWSLLDALKHADRNGNGTIELSELVAHVQDQVPKLAAKLNGRGAAAIAVRGATGDAQSARFGSKGEDFVLAQRLQ